MYLLIISATEQAVDLMFDDNEDEGNLSDVSLGSTASTLSNASSRSSKKGGKKKIVKDEKLDGAKLGLDDW